MILVEPQCYDEEHALVNTVLINGFLNSSPKSEFYFFAEEGHKSKIIDNIHSNSQISFNSIDIPKRGSSDAKRLFAELKLALKIFIFARKVKSNKIIFLSGTSAGIVCIKLLSTLIYKIDVYIILHSVIETIDKKKNWPIWNIPFSLVYSLGLFNKPTIKYVIFNEFSLIRFTKEYPKLASNFLSIEFPFENRFDDSINSCLWIPEKKIVFGTIGDYNERKNSSVFFDLAKRVSSLNAATDFWFIGRLKYSNMDTLNVFIVSSQFELNDQNYHTCIGLIDYSVFLFNSDYYRFSVSGTLYDSITHAKPVIAIRTPFFEDFFHKYGNIGYLCNSYDDMLKLITELSLVGRNDLYLEQQSNLVFARKDLSTNFINSLLLFDK